MKNFKNNYRRNRYRKNGSKNIHQKENGHRMIGDFSNNSNFRQRSQWKNNQNAGKLIEKYTNLAREALSTGDKILSENYFQHAEHFTRIFGDQQKLKNEVEKDQLKNNAENEEILDTGNQTSSES
tara:strand:+ start:308 stop:682 length:375 start_codon:yes stop_codon:yes gene_type:complete